MKATINSRNDIKDGSLGKTYREGSDTLAIRCDRGHLKLTATDGEAYWPHDDYAVTQPRDIKRKLSLELTPQDLKQILDAAIKANLLQTEFIVGEPKKK